MRDVYIVDGARTPFLKARGQPGAFSASDLAVNAGRELLKRQPFSPPDVGEVIAGCVMPNVEETNIGRLIALRMGCGKTVPGWTVQRNCASGMQSLDSAFQDIQTGRYDLVLAGGTEAMSRSPLLWNEKWVNWMSGFKNAKTLTAKLKHAARFRPDFLIPVIALLKGLTDSSINMNMGQTAENLAYRFHITREQMDAFSLESHRRAASAEDQDYFSESRVPLISDSGAVFTKDDGIRRETSLEKLASLKPIFDKKWGTVTAGNSSQVTDGAAMLLLASQDAVKKYQLPVVARIVDTAWAGVDPAEMGLGPVYAISALMKRHHLKKDDIDYWEINEAFAAQVLACLAALEDEEFCRHELGWEKAIGKIDVTRLNVDGGAIALGHPVGASGARIVLQLAHILKRNNAKRGIASLCIGGGLGGAMLIEKVSGVSI